MSDLDVLVVALREATARVRAAESANEAARRAESEAYDELEQAREAVKLARKALFDHVEGLADRPQQPGHK